MADVIKEFLVKLGFKLDEDGVKKFQAGIASATKEVTGLGLKAAGAATAVTAAVTKIAEQYEELYFASIRTGSSASALSTFAFGSKAIGIEAGQAAASLERLNIQLKTNPAMAGMANMDGIKTAGRETKDIYNDIIKMFAAFPKDPMNQAFMFAKAQGIYGIPASELIHRIALIKDEGEAEAQLAEKRRAAGFTPERIAELTKRSTELMHSQNLLAASVGMVWDQAAFKFMPVVTGGTHLLEDFLTTVLKVGKGTDGWSSALLSVATALGAVKVAALLLPSGLAARLGITAAGASAFPLVAGAAAIGTAAAGAIQLGGLAQDKFGNNSKVAWGPGTEWVPGMSTDGEMTRGKSDVDLWKTIKSWFSDEAPSGKSAAAGGAFTSQQEKEAYIRAAFIRNGHDPDVAMRAARGEGFNKFAGDYDATGRPTSFGAFQLHYPGIGRNTADGLGTQFTKDTGLDARDPANERATIDWTAANVGKTGWGPWHGYRGGRFDGLNTNLVPSGGSNGGGGDTNITQTNNVTINGATDPEKTGAVVKRELSSAAAMARQAAVTVR